MKKILLVELDKVSHRECIPSWIKYLNELDYNVDVMYATITTDNYDVFCRM